MFDYETLRIIWWLLLGALLAGFAITDGFDLGTAILSPLLGHSDTERRVILNTVGPVWEGNQVWFVLGGGAIFAAWPPLYAAAFSGFYWAMMLVLATLILRPVGFKFRSKHTDPRWRNFWDAALFAGGLVPALIFGVAVGNLFLGVPFAYDDSLRLQLDVSLFGLLRPFPVLVGIVSVSMLILHGATWLALKTEAPIADRARKAALIASLVFVVTFVLAGVWAMSLDGYVVVDAVRDAPSDPLRKTVTQAAGAWLTNYLQTPLLGLVPVVALLGAIAAPVLARRRRDIGAFIASALACGGSVATAGFSLFPFLLPSSSQPVASLTVWDASSSRLTLAIMLGVTAIGLPIVVAYTSWAYHILRGPVRASAVESETSELY